MGLLQGAVSPRRFLALGPVPEEKDLVDGLELGCFRPLEDGSDEECFGWVDWRNPLIYPPDPLWVSQDRFAVFALRVDTRKVPPLLLKAHVDLRCQRLMKEKDLPFIGREARMSLQDEVRADLLGRVLPVPSVAEVAWDLKGGVLWTTAVGNRVQAHLAAHCMKCFGIELKPLAPLLLAGRLAPGIPSGVLADLEPMDLCGECG